LRSRKRPSSQITTATSPPAASPTLPISVTSRRKRPIRETTMITQSIRNAPTREPTSARLSERSTPSGVTRLRR
jgi:hypothetical protein